MLTQSHAQALAQTGQYDLGMDLLSRLQRVTTYAERLDILEEAEEMFGQLDVRAHATRVAESARSLALHCGFDDTYANRLYNATRLHDIGKLFMPMYILNKDGRPTDEEFALIKEHARHGADLLGPSAPEFVLNVAHYHHERYDGGGYHKLAGEDIPLESRLVQIADVYDALRSKRAYKPGLSEQATLQAMINMQQGKGVSFDPYLFRRFIDMRLAADIDKDISADMTASFAAFAKTSPMMDFEAVSDKSVFGGWEIDTKGQRRKYVYDEEIDYNKLAEKRDALGNVTFVLSEQTPRDKLSVASANDDTPSARAPRF